MRVLVTGGSGFIGTNLIELLSNRGLDIRIIDVEQSKIPRHCKFLSLCDITDEDSVLRIFAHFRPTHVVHLAARTDTNGKSDDDYIANTVGTKSILNAVQRTDSVEHFLFTSSQFVHKSDSLPASDEEFAPYTAYGESKAVGERLTRAAELGTAWTIIRPTNIWGAFHPRYPHEFWRILKRGLYVHPGGPPVMRCYGYVGNVVRQIHRILELPEDAVSGKVLYVGEAPVDLRVWADAFSIAITGRPVRTVPRAALRALALAGDAVSMAGFAAPITSSRYRSMTEHYVTPMEPTFKILGSPEITLEDGVAETVEWLNAGPWSES